MLCKLRVFYSHAKSITRTTWAIIGRVAWVPGLGHLCLPGPETSKLSVNRRADMEASFLGTRLWKWSDSTRAISPSFLTNTIFVRTELPMEIWQDFTFWRHCTFLHTPRGLRSWASQEIWQFPRMQEVQEAERRGAQRESLNHRPVLTNRYCEGCHPL